MNKKELQWMINELNDKATVIRGYAQMALECDHPDWSKKYINSIIRQTDKIAALNTLIASLYLGKDEKNCDSGCKSISQNSTASHNKCH
ncbi:MAG: hypothetical protein HQP61_04505 [Peptococcaceae bacterium]|nr:hypothetical protein [Candidatus Syntrophopropionicum ammoniitolerans]